MSNLLKVVSISSLFVLSYPAFSVYHEESGSEPINQIAESVQETATTTVVMAKFAKDSILSVFDISVHTTNDVVRLKGQVDTSLQYERAIVLALSTDNVSEVNASALYVKPSKNMMEDLYVNAKIKASLIKMAIFDAEDPESWSVKFETKDGKVYITGTVDSAATEEKILEGIKSIKGVKKIQNDLDS